LPVGLLHSPATLGEAPPDGMPNHREKRHAESDRERAQHPVWGFVSEFPDEPVDVLPGIRGIGVPVTDVSAIAPHEVPSLRGVLAKDHPQEEGIRYGERYGRRESLRPDA